LYESKKTTLLPPPRINQILKILPPGPLRKVQSKVQAIADKFRLCPQVFDQHGLSHFDSAFDYKSLDADQLPAGRKWTDFPTLEVRDVFLVFMCEILGDFSRYIRPPETVSATATFQELFLIDVSYSCPIYLLSVLLCFIIYSCRIICVMLTKQ
jgi:hypothetical protein